jgi:hypothetical protein
MSFDVADRKTYTSPKLRRLTEQEGRLLLSDQVGHGEQGVRDMLEVFRTAPANQLRSAEE